jgi:hypothetical protein
MDEEGTGYEGEGAEDSGYTGDSGTQDTEASYDTTSYSDDTGYEASGDNGGDGGWGSFDPSSVTDSVTGGLGDAASSAWHAAGHLAHAAYDEGGAFVHSAEAAADAWISDKEGTSHQIDEAEADHSEAKREWHQAGQDLWGN